ncbi:hypothetical protein F4780DRAFT_150836 [Xylariomycetidae sp. FL0641]|nr:hypothetical protein F4780DRAFT_150836 [Xylariomycetidae sp. FL0641]
MATVADHACASVADHVSAIVLLSIIEGGIDLIAGSLPMLLSYARRWIGTTGRAKNTAPGPMPADIVTVGGTDSRSHNRNARKSRGTRSTSRTGIGLRGLIIAGEYKAWELLAEGTSQI